MASRSSAALGDARRAADHPDLAPRAVDDASSDGTASTASGNAGVIQLPAVARQLRHCWGEAANANRAG
jgi:hypothetical protein